MNSKISKLASKIQEKLSASRRGDCVFPADHSKVNDKKDHFPINSESQARNALARANQYKSTPDWYEGNLESLLRELSRKIHAKFPSIEITEKSIKPGKG